MEEYYAKFNKGDIKMDLNMINRFENFNNDANRYRIKRYGQWHYGIIDNQNGLMLRVGPNPDYSKHLIMKIINYFYLKVKMK